MAEGFRVVPFLFEREYTDAEMAEKARLREENARALAGLNLDIDVAAIRENCRSEEGEKEDSLEDENDIGIPCITDPSVFKGNCLRRRLLKYTYRVLKRQDASRELPNKYTAYRCFTHVIHNRLGTQIQRKIPLCALLRIRKKYPEEHPQDYVGLKAAWKPL